MNCENANPLLMFTWQHKSLFQLKKLTYFIWRTGEGVFHAFDLSPTFLLPFLLIFLSFPFFIFCFLFFSPFPVSSLFFFHLILECLCVVVAVIYPEDGTQIEEARGSLAWKTASRVFSVWPVTWGHMWNFPLVASSYSKAPSFGALCTFKLKLFRLWIRMLTLYVYASPDYRLLVTRAFFFLSSILNLEK